MGGKMKPEVVEVPLGGRYDPNDPVRDPRFAADYHRISPHVLNCPVAAPVVQEWRRALESMRVPVRIETILDPPDQVLLPTLQLVQEIHRMRQSAGVETDMPSV